MAEFFLGANSGKGFYSLYEDFCTDKGDYLHLIKGGPGCGKSNFMRRIGEKAEELGYEVEYILCSGDPDSLDGIYIAELKVGYADATAPHVLEPRHFGADSDYVNLGQFCSLPPRNEVEGCTEKYKSYYKRAYSLLRAAAEIRLADFPNLTENSELSYINRRARSAVSRIVGKPCGDAVIRRRFIHCISCRGELTLSDTINTLCKQICVLDNRLGLANHYLQSVIEAAKTRRDDIIVCPSPLLPDVPEAVIFPHQRVGFIASDVYSADKPYRHVRLDAIIPADRVRAHKSEMKKSEKIYGNIMELACLNLAEAKRLHDELESIYKPYMDFSALDKFTEQEIKKLFA